MKIFPLLTPVFLLGLCSAKAWAQTPAPIPKPRVSAATVQSMVNRVLRETSALRGLSIRRPVRSGVQTRAQVEALFARQIQSVPSDEVVASELYLKQLGLAPASFDLRRSTTSMMGEQVAGYYDPKSGTFYTSDHISPAELETVMAHELTHALQDQHFDLGRLERWPKHDSDSKLAMLSLVEGDATLVMSRYMMANPFRFLGMLGSALRPQASSAVLKSSPRLLREMLIFPYLSGMGFTTNLYRQGRWPRVSRAFDQLPQSTQQVMHFDKYLARKAPVRVALRDVRAHLGARWKLLDHDVDGEEGSALVLGEYLPDKDEVARATNGWAGDRYAVYRGPKNTALVVQDCLWDSEIAARLWRDAYARRTGLRFGAGVAVQNRGALSVWNSGRNGVWMEQRGRRVVILEGTVGAFNPTPVLAALWR